MNDAVYFLIARFLNTILWDGELWGRENIRSGAAVFASNHLGATGPIGVVCSLPVRLYPWIRMETIDKQLAPDYIRQDFVEKELKLKPPLSMHVARIICKIAVPLLLSLHPVPVFSTRQGMDETFNLSMDLLQQGKCVLIMPEDPKQPPDPLTGIRPFMKGFLHLGRLYAEKNGMPLPFYPVTIHEAGIVVIDKPLIYDSLSDPRRERLHIVWLLESTIKARYAELSQTFSPPSTLVENQSLKIRQP